MQSNMLVYTCTHICVRVAYTHEEHKKWNMNLPACLLACLQNQCMHAYSWLSRYTYQSTRIMQLVFFASLLIFLKLPQALFLGRQVGRFVGIGNRTEKNKTQRRAEFLSCVYDELLCVGHRSRYTQSLHPFILCSHKKGKKK